MCKSLLIDMGWMHDTLAYFQSAPKYRTRDYHKLTFSMVYAYNEDYLLPLCHDEVVHGKATIVQKMNGQKDCIYAIQRNGISDTFILSVLSLLIFVKAFQSVHHIPFVLCYNVLCDFVSLVFSLIRVHNALWEDITQGKR